MKKILENVFNKCKKAFIISLAGAFLASSIFYAGGIVDSIGSKNRHRIVSEAKASGNLTFNENDAIILGANMLINGLVGGIGSKINHNGFWNGFTQGTIGGAIVYTGKKTMCFADQSPYFIAMGKEISDLGTSVTYSAAEGENWLRKPRFITDIGPIVFDFNNKWYKPDIGILPSPIMHIGNNIAKGNSFDLGLSLKSGNLVFINNSLYEETNFRGQAGANTIQLDKEEYSKEILRDYSSNEREKLFYRLLAHEGIHTRQYFNYTSLDVFVNRSLNNNKFDKNFIRHLRYENQPFRFGADLGSIPIDLVEDGLYDSGYIEYTSQPEEYEAYHLLPKLK